MILERPHPLASPLSRELEPRRLGLSEGARRLLIVYSDDVESRQLPGCDLAQVISHASKGAEQAARLAAVLTLWSNVDAHEVDEAAMSNGIKLSRYYLTEAVRLAHGSTLSREVELAEGLRRWIVDHWQDQHLVLSDFLQRGPRGLRDRATIKKLLVILVEAGWLVPMELGAMVRGINRKEAYIVVRGPMQ